MTVKNKYVNRAKILEAKFRQLIKYFKFDFDAKTIAFMIKINRNTVNRYLGLIRKGIAKFCELQSNFKDEIEVDEAEFDIFSMAIFL